MPLVVVALLAGTITLACVVALSAWSRWWAGRKPEPVFESADQRARGGHLGWFEGRWARAFHLDVLYAVVLTRDRLLLLRVGGQFSGRHSYGRGPADRLFALEAKRRAKYAEELAAVGSPDDLLGRHRRDFAIPLHEIRRVTMSPRRGLGWVGPAKLVIERAGAPRVTLVLEDGWQVAACARALQAVMGGAVRVDPALALMISDTPAEIRSYTARRSETTSLSLGVLYACFAALVFFTAWGQAHPAPLEAATAHLMSCEIMRRPKNTPVLKMELDVAPRDLRFELHSDDVAALREACRRHAYVNVVYRQETADRPAWAEAIAYVGGREIVSEEVVARRHRANMVLWAAFGGVLAGIGVGTLSTSLWSRRRRERASAGRAYRIAPR